MPAGKGPSISRGEGDYPDLEDGRDMGINVVYDPRVDFC